MEFCWVIFPPWVAVPALPGRRSCRSRGAFPPGTSRPSLSSSGRPRAHRERCGRRGVGWRGRAGAPWALLQPCSSLRRLGGSMWRRPAWQVGPCGAGAALGLRPWRNAAPGAGKGRRWRRGSSSSSPCALPRGWQRLSGRGTALGRCLGKGRGGQSAPEPSPGRARWPGPRRWVCPWGETV